MAVSADTEIQNKKALVIGLCCIFGFMLAAGIIVTEVSKKNVRPKPAMPDDSVSRPTPEEEYLPNIEVKNVRVGENAHGMMCIFGEVKNHGDRIVSWVRIRIFFLDSSGKPINESDWFPVFYIDGATGTSDHLLKPGYVSVFDYYVTEMSSDWAKEVRIEVTAVAFYTKTDETES